MSARDVVEALHELPEALCGDGRVLHDRDRLRVAAHAHQDAQPGLTHPPHAELLTGVREDHPRVCASRTDQPRADRIKQGRDLRRRGPVYLDEQERPRLALNELDERRIADAGAAPRDDRVVHQFHRCGLMCERVRHCPAGSRDGGVVEGDDALHRRDRRETHLSLDDDGERPLGSDHDLGEVDGVVFEERVEVVTRDAAADLRIPLVDLAGVRPRELTDASVEIAFDARFAQNATKPLALMPLEPDQ